MSSSFRDAPDSHLSDPLLSMLLSIESFETFLRELTSVTVAALAPGSMCGISVNRGDRTVTVASSAPLTHVIDEIQYRDGSGPCLDAMATGQERYVPDTSAEARWPAFCAEAAANGVASILALPLLGPGGTVGGYNLYSPERDGFDRETRARLRVFAGNAAGAVTIAMRSADQSKLNQDLRAALSYRSVIDQAIGILMEQQRCSAADAFGLLSRASQNRNVKVHDLAAEIVASLDRGVTSETFQQEG